MSKAEALWKAAQLPLFGIAALLVLSGLWYLFDLPPQEELIVIIKGYIAQYGLVLVFVGAFLEALLLISWYFPGSLVIFISILLSPTPQYAALSVAVVTAALYCGYVVNFFLGKYGWYKVLLAFGIKKKLEEAQSKIERYGVRTIFLSYWHPGLASFTSTAAGILQFNLRKFLILSLIATVVWDSFWGVLVYSLGERALGTILSWPFVIAVAIVWVVARYVEERAL